MSEGDMDRARLESNKCELLLFEKRLLLVDDDDEGSGIDCDARADDNCCCFRFINDEDRGCSSSEGDPTTPSPPQPLLI